MKKRACTFILSIVIVCSLLSASVFAAGEVFTAQISSPDKIVGGRQFNVTINISDVTQGTSIACFDLYLYYDKTKVVPLYRQTEEALGAGYLADTTLITSTPNSSAWEQATLLNTTDGYYIIRLMAGDTGSANSCITSSQGLVLTVPFEAVTVGTDAGALFTISGVTGANISLNPITGLGSTATTTVLSHIDPIIALGSQINTSTVSLRFGAQYNADFIPEGAVVRNLGMVLYPEHLLGQAPLTVSTPGAVVMTATGIANYDPTKTFYDYEQIIFYVTINSVPLQGMNTGISFKAFYTYTLGGVTTIVYSEKMTRSYQFVHDAVYGTAPGGKSGDNTVIVGPSWWN
ncbi:MAG: hypothetical protein CVU97_03615 [Firmicutes bacterium HGW-Firmicutes-21]|nr:MAG: hypothetical protein CVU97_03615 [Firmicutes bacterium HGW-Firmicutes-21]